jgi:glutamate-1-semialdehyde 2,1-aminomutase
MKKTKSDYFVQARQIIAGGVNSPVRAWKAVGGRPVFVSHAKGSKIYDVAGIEYVDYVLSWGPMILGHAHPKVIAAICAAARNGTSFGAPTHVETQMAKLISEAIPSMEL